MLKRAGISRPARPPREPANSYEWPCPGDLLHMDVSRYARFERPGHAVTGDRSQGGRRWMSPHTRVGYDHAHAIVDDHSRLAYVELHTDERAHTVTAFVERARRFFERHGIRPRRVMMEWAYGLAYHSHRHRNRALPNWLEHYNRHRPHSSLGGQAPTSRIHNVRG